MKNLRNILIVLFCIIYFASFSQGEFVIEIDRTNGSFIKTGPAIADIILIYPDDRTFNENTGIFFFPSATINHSLYSINVSSGSIVNNPVIGNIKTFQFDNISNILYGIEYDNTNNVKNFISINPVTGAYTQIGNSLPSSSTFSGNFSTFNKINQTYIFLAPPNILYSINASNGNIISNPNLSIASGESIINFSFDNSTGILYGLLQDNNVQKYFLVIINPTTGTNTKIGSGTTFGAGNGSSTIDETNQQYIYMYSSGGGYFITTLDISTGNIVYNNLISPLSGLDNVVSLKYDNTQGKLYSIHWDDITINPGFTATISKTDILCSGECNGTATVTTTGGISPFTYNWSNGKTTQTITGLCVANYSVTVTDSTSNSANTSVSITQPAEVLTAPLVFSNSCSNDSNGSASLSASGGTPPYSYNWINGQTTSSISNLSPGNYSVTISDANGCTDYRTIFIDSITPPDVANAGTDTTICEGENIFIGSAATSGYNYSWQPSAGLNFSTIAQPLAFPNQNTLYILTVNDSDNICTPVKDSVFIAVHNCDTIEPVVPSKENISFLPSMFSPNGDGNNDIFRVRGENFAEIYFIIYNRWGEKVFETTDKTQGWDGTQNGKPLNAAVFVYYAKITFADGSKEEKKGNITLVR